ncbi:MAG TPA: Gfo/Idh/MocA family oxidoreductase, partial [Firmicutes bacterium]|nr:Gfo/Idh/MocA family oxidoreductase [Bacillota bacterium]
MQPLRVGIVGAGRFADKAIFPALRQIDGIQVAAVYSRSEDRAREIAANYNVALSFTDIRRFCSDARLDCALVLTPPQAHFWAVKNLLEAGVDVFCEKPLSPSLSEIEEMVELADGNKRVFMAGFNRRFAPMFVSAKEAFGEAGVDL